MGPILQRLIDLWKMGFQGNVGLPHFDFLLKNRNGICIDQAGNNILALIANGKVPPQL